MEENISLKDLADELEKSLYSIAKEYSSMTIKKSITPNKNAIIGLYHEDCNPLIKIHLFYRDNKIEIEYYDSIPKKYEETTLPTELNLLLNDLYKKLGKQPEDEIKNYITLNE